MDTINEAAILAMGILNNGSQYASDKAAIDFIFSLDVAGIDREHLRITVIDSYYSTNMSKRLFGISDIVEKIRAIGNDQLIREECARYLNTGSPVLEKLLCSKNGIRKYGDSAGESKSLISKYLYFLTNHEFPIEDSLVREYANIVFDFFGLETIDTSATIFEMARMSRLTKCTIDYLDGLLWLFGKISKGSLSLILSREKYLKAIEILGLSGNRMKSEEFDNVLSEMLKDKRTLDKLITIFDSNTTRFIKFCNVANNKK